MPIIRTSLHDPDVLAAVCEQMDLPPPTNVISQTESDAANSWLVSLPGLHRPLECDLLNGLITYHPKDNAFHRYRRIMAFVQHYYAVRARGRQRFGCLFPPIGR